LGEAPSDVTAEYKVREGGEKMKAPAWFGTNDVRVIDAPIPDVTDPDDVIVKVTGTTICGTSSSKKVHFLLIFVLNKEFWGLSRIGFTLVPRRDIGIAKG
jgi:hypothetical protein